MTYAEAIDFLHGLSLFGARPGLEQTVKLAALAGNPQERLRFIHVAGTNGKGSTCALLESIYRAAGLRVGLYTSPHLVAFGERIQVNRRLIGEPDIVRLAEGMQPWLKSFSHDAHPTFFEVVTVMALQYFAEQKCDLVIWETGLGGRLDATNIVTPLASVIANIQFDHQKWLGDTLEKIAFEKAGIIKPGVPVVTATDAPEALTVIRQRAAELSAPLTCVTESDTRKPPMDEIQLPLRGAHQRLNAALAVATVGQVDIPVSDAALRRGLETVSWTGRLQLLEPGDGRRVLLDGAHNPAGVATLLAALREEFSGAALTLVLGMLADKDCAAMCALLAPHFKKICLVPVSSNRTAPPAELHAFCRQANPSAEITIHGSVAGGLTQVVQDQFVVVCGSLYLLGEVLELLAVHPSPARGERGLNEWGGTPRA